MNENVYVLDEKTITLFNKMCPFELEQRYNSSNSIALGYIEDKKAKGFIFARIMDDLSLFIEWLYVGEKYRENGIGRVLLDELVKLAHKSEDVEYISLVCPGDELRHWFILNGFSFDDDDIKVAYTTTIGKMIDLPVDNSSDLRKLNSLESEQVREMNYTIKKKQLAPGLTLPIRPEDYTDESLVLWSETGVEGFILFKKSEDVIDVSYLYAKTGKKCRELLGKAKELLVKEYGLDHRISACALNTQSSNLIKKIFTEATDNSYYYCALFKKA